MNPLTRGLEIIVVDIIVTVGSIGLSRKKMRLYSHYAGLNMKSFTSRYPVFGGINDEKWSWLCSTIGKPGQDWRSAKGAIWFKQEADRVMFLLRWS